MLRIRKPALSPELQADLDDRQKKLNSGQVGKTDSWKAFTSYENQREKRGMETVRSRLRQASFAKCAYCERSGATTIDHFIPRSTSGPEGDGKRTTFSWDNLLWCCRECNSDYKQAPMRWNLRGEPQLLNPCQEEPACFFDFLGLVPGGTAPSPSFALGRIRIRSDLDEFANERAIYSRDEALKLNARTDLVAARKERIDKWMGLMRAFDRDGPDAAAPSGRLLRDVIREFLEPTRPHLAPIRQWLRETYPDHFRRLVQAMPELRDILADWCLEIAPCDRVRSPSAAMPEGEP